MTQLANLDTMEITTWLTRATQTIDRSLRDAARGQAMSALSAGLGATKVGLPVLAQLALLDDCLRVAHMAIAADGHVEPEEIARVADLVRVAASKYFCVLPRYESFDDVAGGSEIERFLRTHQDDIGSFGYRNPAQWRGLHVARLVEQHTRNASPLREHERMLARIMDTVFAGRTTQVERDARRKLRDLFEPPPTQGADPRAIAFCRDDGPEVFSSVAHGSHIHERDPFDIESIHAEAREVFHQQLERATTPEQTQRGHGRTMLVLGGSGAGKTHLLRALRAQVHSQRLGYVGYLQMTSEVGDYARYVLRSLIDSMERPYDAPALSESALMYLSDGLVDGRVEIPADELERLRTAVLGADELQELLGQLVDRIVRTDGLGALETDLVQALLLLQRRDPALQRRVVKYLRCEALNDYDRRLVGGLAARTEPEDPLRTLKQLAIMMHELQLAALVLMIDQIEETIPDGQTITRLQQAFDTLRAIADAVPSAVVVIACLDDVYDAVRPRLSRSLVDRLERDPVPVRLTSQREPLEIEHMLVRRLEHLYSAFDVPWRDDDPLYPFAPEQIESVGKLRARDCLATFREYHAACIAARAIIASESRAVAPPSPAPSTPADAKLEHIWSSAMAAPVDLPDDDEALLELVAEALRGLSTELETAIDARRERAHLVIESPQLGRRVVGICNRAPQGGHLGNQFDAMRALAVNGAIPIALRGSDFEFKAKSKTSLQLAALLQAGGRAVAYTEHELRALTTARALTRTNPPGFAQWRRTQRPIARLAFVRAMLDLDHEAPRPATASSSSTAPASAPTPTPTPTPTPIPITTPIPIPPTIAITTPITTPTPISTRVSSPTERRGAQTRRASAPIVTVDAAQIRLGTTTTLRAEPVLVPIEQVKTHVTFIGGTGSGKTTAALSMAEQLLERGISVLLVDRKGDLARYASRAWWSDSSTHDARRKADLRARIDVALYTPGNAHGRPLRLPLIPSLADASAQERIQLAQFAAGGVGAMMGYGTSSTHKARQSVLQCAIQLHGDDRDISLEVLLDTINRPDPELLRSVGALQRHFAGLSEDLQTLQIQRGSLLASEGEALDVAALLPVPGAGRPRLSIINLSSLTEVSVLQFWVSRLLVELSRLARKRPSKTLQAAAFFDEADAYVPAIGSPPTKEPMFDLLRRARSTGIGVLLATQNPGDFDYKARDNIGTWLVGKVAQDRAIEKMRNLLANYPSVGPRLATQSTGHFFVLANGQAREIKCDRSLMNTEQMSDLEVAELARTSWS
jgi:hypothetical protein